MSLTFVAPFAVVFGLTPIVVDIVLFRIWSAVNAKSEGICNDCAASILLNKDIPPNAEDFF